MHRGLVAVLLLLGLASCTGGIALVKPLEARKVAGGPLSVTPGLAWNRIPVDSGSGRPREVWTRDGPSLNEISFYPGIRDGKTMFRDSDKRDRPLPRFRATMLPHEVAEFVENSYRVETGTASFQITAIAPAMLGSAPGFRFGYDYLLGDDVKRRGQATAAIVKGQLFLVTYEAPALYFFERDLPEYERIIASARLG